MKDKYKEIARSIPNSDCSFKYIEISKGTALPVWGTDQHMLLFVLDGQLKLTFPDGGGEVSGAHFLMIPKQHEWKGFAVTHSKLLILLFNMVDNVWTKPKIKALLDVSLDKGLPPYPLLPIRSPLNTFLDLIVVYTEERNIDRSFYASKENELLSILYTFYTPEELAPMFYPLLTTNLDFKSFVQSNYLKVESVAELAELAGCSQVTLNRKFKEYFGESAYQWMIRSKTVQIQKRLQNPTASLSDIAKEFGFYSGSELNRFCQRQFGTTALKIRKQALGKEKTRR